MSYYVYFITHDKKGFSPVKIGYSKCPESRLSDLQTANPTKLKIAVKLPFETKSEAVSVESQMHRLGKAKHKKLEGEWFMIYGSWKKFIAQVMKVHDGNRVNKRPTASNDCNG